MPLLNWKTKGFLPSNILSEYSFTNSFASYFSTKFIITVIELSFPASNGLPSSRSKKAFMFMIFLPLASFYINPNLPKCHPAIHPIRILLHLWHNSESIIHCYVLDCFCFCLFYCHCGHDLDDRLFGHLVIGPDGRCLCENLCSLVFSFDDVIFSLLSPRTVVFYRFGS